MTRHIAATLALVGLLVGCGTSDDTSAPAKPGPDGPRQLWTFPDGKYTPVVADRDRLYSLGYARLYGMVERR